MLQFIRGDKMISKDNDRLTIIISKEVKEKLKLLALKDNRTLSNYITTLLNDHVKEKEKEEE